jgi:hypothetical protein
MVLEASEEYLKRSSAVVKSSAQHVEFAMG